MQVVLIATRWGMAEGGINAFNQQFAVGLAKVGSSSLHVTCAVAQADDPEIAHALAAGIRLLVVGNAVLGRDDQCGRRVVDLLGENGNEERVDLWVGHDTKTGFAAVKAAASLGGRPALFHHMVYESYHNLGGGRGDEAAARHEEQIDLFSTSGAILFGVGDDLKASVSRLGNASAYSIVPGFPEGFSRNSAGNEDLRVIVAGRFDAGAEPLKQSRLAAAGLGRAVRLAGNLPALGRPTLSIFGATPDAIRSASLEIIASKQAGRFVNVVPTGFDAARGVGRHLSRSNLAIMPSVREGFGLIGWEAIGCEVPLILGDQTGLSTMLRRALDGRTDRWVSALPLTGRELDERDIEAMADAIICVARDLEHARQKATQLRRLLKDRLNGCTWPAAAQGFLDACGIEDRGYSMFHRSRARLSADSEVMIATPNIRTSFRMTTTNHRHRCAELELDERVGQGSTDRRFDVLATLRFGQTELEVDDMHVSIGVQRALVYVTSEHGRLSGDRLGDGPDAPPGIVANAGGVWELTPPGGGVLCHKVLGDDVLCRIETPPNLPAHAKVEVTAARKDLACDIRSARALKRSTNRVMKLFLEKALFEPASGHMILSSAELREEPDA